MKLDGASIIVSGGASGLGAATVELLTELGAKAVIIDLDEDKGNALAKQLDNAAFVKADVTDEAQVQAAIDTATQLGPLRLAVCCAGVGWPKRTLNREGAPLDLDFFKTVVNINLVGTFNVLRLAAAAMAKNEPDADNQRGAIVTTASVAAFDGQIGQAAYAASKAGVAGMTLPIARDLGVVGIRVVTLAPGIFDTPMLAGLPEAAREALPKDVVFPKRLGTPAEFARMVAAIAENPYLNGTTIRLDGALRMPPK